ncbi:hypothetical protein COP2_008010 [Malus domestica]
MHKTKLFATLSDHLDSLHKFIYEKSHSLESKIQSLESRSRETLQSLDHRETSIPKRGSSAVARIKEQKAAALPRWKRMFSGIWICRSISNGQQVHCSRKVEVSS